MVILSNNMRWQAHNNYVLELFSRSTVGGNNRIGGRGAAGARPVLIVKRCLICLFDQRFACHLIIKLHR